MQSLPFMSRRSQPARVKRAGGNRNQELLTGRRGEVGLYKRMVRNSKKRGIVVWKN